MLIHTNSKSFQHSGLDTAHEKKKDMTTETDGSGSSSSPRSPRRLQKTLSTLNGMIFMNNKADSNEEACLNEESSSTLQTSQLDSWDSLPIVGDLEEARSPSNAMSLVTRKENRNVPMRSDEEDNGNNDSSAYKTVSRFLRRSSRALEQVLFYHSLMDPETTQEQVERMFQESLEEAAV